MCLKASCLENWVFRVVEKRSCIINWARVSKLDKLTIIEWWWGWAKSIRSEGGYCKKEGKRCKDITTLRRLPACYDA